MTRQELKSYAQYIVKLGEQHVAFARAVLKLLGDLDRKEPPHPCHQQAVALWQAFLQKQGIPMVMDARQGKQLKGLLYSLQRLTQSKTPEGAIGAFAFILDKYHLLDDWHQRHRTLSNIHKNLQEILNTIKNGNRKTTANRHHTQQRAAERGAAAELARRILLQGEAKDGA